MIVPPTPYAVGQQYSLRLGHNGVALAGTPGLAIAITGTAPTAIPGYSGGGYFAISQIVNAASNVTAPVTFPYADGCPLMNTTLGVGNLPVTQTNYYVAPGAVSKPIYRLSGG
jgi:hypothetical protein